MMELSDIGSFSKYVEEVASVTTDMGVESHLHGFRLRSLLEVLLPNILKRIQNSAQEPSCSAHMTARALNL